MDRIPDWFWRVLFALPFAGFGLFTLLVFPEGLPKGSVDWWVRYASGWVFLGGGLWIVLSGQAQTPLRRWLQELSFVLLFVLFLVPINLMVVAPLSDESGIQILFLTLSSSGVRWINRLPVVFGAAVFDLFGVALVHRFLRRTKELWQDKDRGRLP